MSWLFNFRWPEYGGFSFSISPSSECSGLISFRIERFGFLAVQGILKMDILSKLQVWNEELIWWNVSVYLTCFSRAGLNWSDEDTWRLVNKFIHLVWKTELKMWVLVCTCECAHTCMCGEHIWIQNRRYLRLFNPGPCRLVFLTVWTWGLCCNNAPADHWSGQEAS